MIQNTPELTILLPAYREDENLRLLLPRIHQAMNECTDNYEIIVIDSKKSLDSTLSTCNLNKSKHYFRTPGDSYGDAIRTGIEKAQGKYIVILDADGSHSPEWIKELYNERNEFDLIIASRYIQNGDTENPAYLIYMSRILNWTYSVIFGIKCKDISNSFRLYKLTDLKKLKLKCNNFDLVEEIIIKLVKNDPKYTIKEIPFVFKKRMFGQSKRKLMVFIAGYIFTLFKLKFLV